MVALFIITGGAQAAEQATSHGMLIGFFLYPHTPTLLALFLFAWALYLILNYYFTVFTPTKREITRISKVLSRHRDPESFASNFKNIDEAFANTSSFRDGWREFCETLHQTTAKVSGNPIYHNTKRPQDYLNERSITQSGRNIRELEFYPGIFVALGLVLTFIGLVVALMATQDAIITEKSALTNETTERVTNALNQLIGASAFKFITSISGISCSIVITWKSRSFVSDLSTRLLSLQNQLERGLVHLSAEIIQLRVADETSALAKTIREGFSEAIMEISGTELRNFATRMENIGLELQHTDDAVNQLGKSYKDQLEKLSQQFILSTDMVSKRVKDFETDLLKQQTTFFDQLQEQHQEQTKQIVESFTEHVNITQSCLSDFQASAQTSIETSHENLSDAARNITDHAKDIMTAYSQDLSSSSKDVFAEANEGLSELKLLVDSGFDMSLETLREVNNEFIKLSQDQIEQYTSQLTSRVNDVGDGISVSLKQLSDNFSGNVGEQFEHLSETTLRLVSATEKALNDHNSLQNQSTELISSITQVAEKLDRMNDDSEKLIQESTNKFTTTSEKIDTVANQIGELSTTLETKTNTEFDRLESILERMESGMKTSANNLGEMYSNSAELSKTVNSDVSQFLKEQSRSQGELSIAIEALRKELQTTSLKLEQGLSLRSLFGRLGK